MEWTIRVDEWSGSGLSARKWCKAKKISYLPFIYWRKRLQGGYEEEIDDGSEMEIKFIELPEKQDENQKIASAKSGFSLRSGKRIEAKQNQPSISSERAKSNPRDPFREVWDDVLVPLLEQNPHLQALTLLRHLQDLYKDQFPDKLIRTLQRRVRNWRAMFGPEKEIIFRQNHPPGQQALSDFTNCNELQVTINQKAFPHLLYHFWLPFSSWEFASVVLGGESYTALAENLKTDPEKAKQLFDEGMKELGLTIEDFPKLEILHSQESYNVRSNLLSKLCEQVNTTLGIQISINYIPWKLINKNVVEQNFQMCFLAWSYLVNTPLQLLDCFQNPQYSHYILSNKKYYNLLQLLKHEPDNSKQKEKLAEIEQLLVEELPVIPIYYSHDMHMKSTHLKGFYINPNTSVIDFKYAYFISNEHVNTQYLRIIS